MILEYVENLILKENHRAKLPYNHRCSLEIKCAKKYIVNKNSGCKLIFKHFHSSFFRYFENIKLKLF